MNEANYNKTLATLRLTALFAFIVALVLLAKPRPVEVAIGFVIAALGEAVRFWAAGHLLKTKELITSGPYRYTRNPIYVGMTAVYLSVALLANAAWPLVMLPVVLVIVATMVIGREERYLSRTFGEEYLEYCRRVRRWL